MRKKVMGVLAAAAVSLSLIPGMAFASSPVILGGWSEDGTVVEAQAVDGIATLSEPHHYGEAQQSTNSQGTTIKRAHGWTTWSGVYHYTTAQMEHDGIFCNGKVITSSGRQWARNGTEAYSPWATFNPDLCCGNLGQARTYYGR